MAGRVEMHFYESVLLADNALGDATVRNLPVYLPPGYDAGQGRYPVLYALAGFTGTGRSYLGYDWYRPTFPERLDRLIDTGAMRPCVVVMVDGMTSVGGNQYIDSAAAGPWGSHVTRELVPWAEATFRLEPGRDHRGVFGKSSGGYGALMMAIEHADVFAAAASHSGDCYFEYCYGPEFPRAVDGLRAEGGLGPFLEKLRRREWPKFPGRLFSALTVVAMAHFYSPNADAAHGFDLPFDEATGELREDVLARWYQRDPVRIVGRHAEALASLKLLWIECGTSDEWNLHHGARILSARLDELGVRHHHEEFEDGHRSLDYRYDVSLPALVEALG